MLNCGIYKITNLATGSLYIGQSVNIRKRKDNHFCHLRKGKHCSPYLQHSYDKYGEENFKFEILLYCEPFELTRYEQALVDKWKPVYNTRKECVDSNRGIPKSEECKRLLSKINTGNKHTDETKLKMSEAKKGVPFTEEHKNNMSKSFKGQQHFLGHTHTEDTKYKMSAWQIGRTLPESTKIKISESHKKANLSEETRRKMSESAKLMKAREHFNDYSI